MNYKKFAKQKNHSHAISDDEKKMKWICEVREYKIKEKINTSRLLKRYWRWWTGRKWRSKKKRKSLIKPAPFHSNGGNTGNRLKALSRSIRWSFEVLRISKLFIVLVLVLYNNIESILYSYKFNRKKKQNISFLLYFIVKSLFIFFPKLQN